MPGVLAAFCRCIAAVNHTGKQFSQRRQADTLHRAENSGSHVQHQAPGSLDLSLFYAFFLSYL